MSGSDRHVSPVLAVGLSLMLWSHHGFGAEARFHQDRFAIGYWVGPQTSENLEARYREIAEANFTLVIGTPDMTPTRSTSRSSWTS